MFNTYSPWGELALQPHLTLKRCEFDDPETLGRYEHQTRTIWLAHDLCRRQARSVLAHELRHAEYHDTVTHCGRTNLRQEQRADREAAWLMIDVRDLARAIVIHDGHHSATAVELGVTDAMLADRYRWMHPNERHYLARQHSDLRVA